MSSPAQIAANRANALRSTGPRTPEGKSISRRNALAHGAYASDDTLLALSTPPAADPTPEHLAESPSTPTAVLPAVPPQPAAVSAYLTAYSRHYVPLGPAEELLVRRLAACAARLDLLSQAMDALMNLDERRALLEHLDERYSLSSDTTLLRKQPDWSGPIHRYDDPSYINPYPEERHDNPALDPDPADCTLAYTTTSPRALTLFRLEERAERRFLTILKELHSLQALRRRSLPTHSAAPTPEQSLIEAVDLRVRRILSAHGLDPNARPVPGSTPILANEPISQNDPAARLEPTGQSGAIGQNDANGRNEPNCQHEPIDRNEPATPSLPCLQDENENEPAALPPSQPAPTPLAPTGGNEPSAHPVGTGAVRMPDSRPILMEGSQLQPSAPTSLANPAPAQDQVTFLTGS
jgi:hypothetical protein